MWDYLLPDDQLLKVLDTSKIVLQILEVMSPAPMRKEATIVSGDRVRGVPCGQPGQLGGDQLVPQLKQGHCQGGLTQCLWSW